MDDDVAIKEAVVRWRKGELIGCGAFGTVYMGMNLDSGELLAVKQVSITVNNASKEKTQAHIRELEEEVNLLKNLSHPNIVRYLGTAREDESMNILLEFVPGGSISSLLGKFGSFPESVIRMYTKQLLLGLEYLHKNGIMHRDIKGANILVDNKGCIKLADFGASKKVVELATMTGAKSMKGTPYWMAPEVILQTGHNFSADIWSVGCTVIEMATGKPPWSQQYQEVAALFHIGTTKSHPPIPEHLSVEAVDFLLKCLQKEPSSRPAASDLLRHRFVRGEHLDTCAVSALIPENPGRRISTHNIDFKIPNSHMPQTDACSSVRCSILYRGKFSEDGELWGWRNCDDDMCQIDDDDLVAGAPTKPSTSLIHDDLSKSFNPMSEPNYDWPCNFDETQELKRSRTNMFPSQSAQRIAESTVTCGNLDDDFPFPSGPSLTEDDDEVTELKIRAFLDEKALDLKKLQTPLYEEFFNSINAADSANAVGIENKENPSSNSSLPPKSKSPKRPLSRRLSTATDVSHSSISGTHSRRLSNISAVSEQTVKEVQSPKLGQLKEPVDAPQEISPSFSERQKIWEEELYEELQKKREKMRQTGGAKTPSPNRSLNQQKDRSKFTFAGK